MVYHGVMVLVVVMAAASLLLWLVAVALAEL